MKINNPYQNSLRTKLEKEILDYRNGDNKDLTLRSRIDDFNRRFNEDLRLNDIVNFSEMFMGATTFNQPLSSWMLVV